MGRAGDPPAPVPDASGPTGREDSYVVMGPFPLDRSVVSVPSGESPDGTGGSPVLPRYRFHTTFA